MEPVTASVTIDRPREEVFEYLADMANHSEFTDHYVTDFRLTREDSYGRGAGARFRLDAPRGRFHWADVSIRELEHPRRIVEAGRTGKFNRVRTMTTYVLEPGPHGTTRLELTTETVPATLPDRLIESFGFRRWMTRQTKKTAKRLRSILEEGEERGVRATVAGGPRKPASQYRL